LAPGRDRPRFAGLDAMRGLAALAVVLFHVFGPLRVAAAPKGYLAVDFFFLLSGFVIAGAYAARLKPGLGWTAFMGLRLARLYPLLLLGMVMGVVVALAAPGARPSPAQAPAFAAAALSEALLLPVLRPPRASDTALFVFNPPIWTLALEIAANALYAAIAPRLTVGRLAALIALAWVGLVISALRHGSLQVGAEAASLDGGLARVGFSFFGGVALHRLVAARGRPRLAWGPALGAGLLALALFAPDLIDRRLFDLAVVTLVFPAALVLSLGGEPRGSIRSAALLAGALSYPLYATHFPIMRAFLASIQAGRLTGSARDGALAAAFAAMAAAAILALWLYDQPVRAWLRGRRLRG
jgi:peptidoglycan/LPS O-acetylase OafA/YrhL